jgi:prepilin-type N-terminal cleavage/methylation domain-containing protein
MVKNTRGFTIIEVMAVLAIVALLMAGLFSFFFFNQKMYSTGSSQANLHSTLRQTAERISSELRYVWRLSLLNEDEWDPEDVNTENFNYIYYDPEAKTVFLLNKEGRHPLSDQVISGISFEAKGSILLFTLDGVSGKTSFTLQSSVRPLNYNAAIAVPENPIAVRFIPFELGSPPDLPESPESPEEDPDNGDSETTTRMLATTALPKLSGKNKNHSQTMTWTEVFVKPITDVSFSFSRTITGETKNSNFSGQWELIISDGYSSFVVISETIRRPTDAGDNFIHVSLSDLPFDALQPINIRLEVLYNSGNHNHNWIQPVFGNIQMEATFGGD